MKLFEIAKQLEERKSVGIIYHFTSYKGMLGIIGDGFKLANKFGDPKDDGSRYISFTRDKRMVTDSVFREVRITVDGTMLSDRYQIRPYADSHAGYGRTTQDEKEERALVRKQDGFVDISGAIIRIDVRNINTFLSDDEDDFGGDMQPPGYSDYLTLLKILPKTQIPYKIVDKY